MPQVLEDEIRITQNDANVVLTAGVANTETVIAKFTCPDRTAFAIRPGDILTVTVKDTTPTEVAGTSLVKVIHTDPNGIVKRTLVMVDYTVLTEWKDRNEIYTFGSVVKLRPDDILQIAVTANLAAATAQTRFQISALRGATTIL